MNITPREKETYELFTKYRKENPEATVNETYKATGTNAATLHEAKKKMGLIVNPKKKPAPQPPKNKPGPKPGSKQKPKPKQASPMQTLIIPEERKENFAVIICNQNSLQDVLNAIR